MSKKLGLFLVLGGLVIGGIAYFGNQAVNKKSDVEYLQEAMWEQQEQAEQAQKDAATLSSKVLKAPKSCEGLKTGFVYEICDTEPYEGDWPDWTEIASGAEQACILQSFHRTNKHAFAIQGKPYKKESPSINRVGNFAIDVCGASLATDGIDYDDRDKSISDLINGFYADRAESMFAPKRDY